MPHPLSTELKRIPWTGIRPRNNLKGKLCHQRWPYCPLLMSRLCLSRQRVKLLCDTRTASRAGAPQASYDKRRHRNCFQTRPLEAFQKSKHLLGSKISWCDHRLASCADLDRSILRGKSSRIGTTQVDFEVDRPPHADSSPGDFLITMVKKPVTTYSHSHSDSLNTLLYVRFAIQNLEFYEWKLGDHGWTLPWHRTHTHFALWPDVTSCFTYEKNRKRRSLVLRELDPFQNFAIPLRNLQFHCKYVSLWEGFSEHCGLSPLRGPTAWAISGMQPSSVRGGRWSVGEFRTSVTESFSLDFRQQATVV